MRKMRSARVQELANIAWSLATLIYQDQPLLEAISSESLQKMSDTSFGRVGFVDPYGDAQDCANLAWAFAVLEYLDAPLLASIAASSIRLI